MHPKRLKTDKTFKGGLIQEPKKALPHNGREGLGSVAFFGIPIGSEDFSRNRLLRAEILAGKVAHGHPFRPGWG